MNQTLIRPRDEKARSILRQVAALERMTQKELREQWRVLFGAEPPDYSHSVLVRRLSWRVQELAYGGLPAETRAQMEERRRALGLEGAAGARTVSMKRRAGAPVPGTRFVREWDGRRWEVTVTQDGYEFQGRTFRSLSAIAKAITGTHWNGRAFFGLYRPRPVKKEARA